MADTDKWLRAVLCAACLWLVSCSTGVADDPVAAARQLDGIESLLVWQGGEYLVEAYFEGRAQDQRDVRSVTKSITALLFGIAVDRNLVAPSDPVTKYLSANHAEHAPGAHGLTLEHLLTMSAGLDWDEAQLAEYVDWQSALVPTHHYLSRPRVMAPGSAFNYSSGAAHLLSEVIAAASGMPYAEFAQQHLFRPLGFGPVTWQQFRDGSTNGASALKMSARDLIKVGQLMLADGVWDGRQIVSADWLAQMTQRQIGAGRAMGYGYLWWIPEYNERSWVARGFGGQQLVILPEHDSVVVTTARWRGLDGPSSVYQAIAIGQYVELELASRLATNSI